MLKAVYCIFCIRLNKQMAIVLLLNPLEASAVKDETLIHFLQVATKLALFIRDKQTLMRGPKIRFSHGWMMVRCMSSATNEAKSLIHSMRQSTVPVDSY
jgi:hypothetical protein